MSSTTRRMVAGLRERLGYASPMGRAMPAQRIPDPPHRVFPTKTERGPYALNAAKHTSALVGIGHVGTRYATEVVLQFQAELAVAHEAVAAEFSERWAESQGLVPLQSRVREHREFLLRPDLGRRLDEESLVRLRAEASTDVDVQIILADGLSAKACMESGMALLAALEQCCQKLGLSVGSRLCAQYARVWLQDEIGAEVRAKVAIIILGERPGLGTGDGLSAYLVYQPKLGNTDSDRNMISNIHERGVSTAEAGTRLAKLALAMIQQECSGVALDISGLSETRALSAASVREGLVSVEP